MATPSHVVSRLVGGRAGNPIVEAIRGSNTPTDGDQLEQFVARNRSLIKEFVLVLCGFLIVVMIILFFTLLVVVMTNEYAVQSERAQFERALLNNYAPPNA
ncbi:hypothetical protein QKQ66_gp056 [Dione juno nucleopolyhedrovirus]|uniref:Ac108 n=1 Tax=Dione juno nucleopolyhedrovirus TaxID=2594175 RepID=A0AAE6H2R9_9ABAC|nr:hypothetical protein QKQ66_gp056 [Dione juno nucleopolyhedrovirus]QDL56957.1 hypothetical protein DijuNPV-ORF-56 [Dione juno nucleopolyhedrovirus]